MHVDEENDVLQDHRNWKALVSTLPDGKTACSVCMYTEEIAGKGPLSVLKKEDLP